MTTADRPGAGASPTGTRDVADVVARLRATFAGGRTRDPAWRTRQLRGIERMLPV